MRRPRILVALLGLGLLGLVNACGGDDDDSAQASQAEKCETFKKTVARCYDTSCQTDTSSFCGCWQQGLDMNATNCECVPRNMDIACQTVDLDKIDPAQFNCSAAMSALGNFCTDSS